MANIALNKPSGGQLILSPEDGTSTETVTIPSVGVGKVLQVVTAGLYNISGQVYMPTDSSASNTDGHLWQTVNFTPKSSSSKVIYTLSTQALLAGGFNQCIAIFKDGVNVAQRVSYSGGGGSGSNPITIVGSTSSSATTISFTVRVGANNPADTYYFGQSYFGSSVPQYAGEITIMEVAA